MLAVREALLRFQGADEVGDGGEVVALEVVEDAGVYFLAGERIVEQSGADADRGRTRDDELDRALPEFEKTLIRIAMSQTNGHRQEAARLLGWGRNTLTRKMKALHLD